MTIPVLIGGTILAGHGRVDAARLIGMERVPCVRLEQDDRAENNKLALNAAWDDEILAEELRALPDITSTST